jgi:DnaJ-class molecular chaperone
MKQNNMDINKNYYAILKVTNSDEIDKIKKSYYKISMKLHPDKNEGIETDEFRLVTEAWSILKDSDKRTEYDRKSKWGKDYNEFEEFYNINMEYDHKKADSQYEKVKNREVLDIILNINKDEFDGTLEFPRFVLCPTCKGSGKDMSGKIMIKNDKGEVKWFEAEDGCDVCEGTGEYSNNTCFFCNGEGKVGMKQCSKCDGERRILGKQKLTGIKLDGDETKIESMGNVSYYDRGRVGNLILKLL